MSARTTESWTLHLLGRWELWRGEERVEVGARQQRLIAAAALYGRRSRQFLSELLWPDSGETRAAGSLRATLWHVTHELPGVLQESGGMLALSRDVDVDVDDLYRHVDSMSEDSDLEELVEIYETLATAVLLPRWQHDWVLSQQEELHTVRLDAFENLARLFLARCKPQMALVAAQGAVELEPLRETPQRLLVQAHRAAGDHAAALRVYTSFCARIQMEFGFGPSEQFTRLVERSAYAESGACRPGS